MLLERICLSNKIVSIRQLLLSEIQPLRAPRAQRFCVHRSKVCSETGLSPTTTSILLVKPSFKSLAFRTNRPTPLLTLTGRKLGSTLATVTSATSKFMASALRDSSLLKSHGLIGGRWVGADSGETFKVINPATGELITEVPHMGEEETKCAIKEAAAAFPAWSKQSAKHRSKVLRAWYDLLMANKEDLAVLMTLEQGKPLAEARGEVEYGAGFVEFNAEEAKRVYGDVLPAPVADRRTVVLKQAIGVVGAITPWNFPLAMITRKIAPALAVGCCAVVKPAELTPLTALAAAELALRAGLPPGVLNVVIGDAPAIGRALLESPLVRKIGFTGSTAVGKLLMAGAASTVKKVSLELGGNAPLIVFNDANLELAVKGAMAAKYRNTGQTCVCANRLLVQEGVYDQFAEMFAKEVAGLRVGNGLTEGVTQGPLINEAAVEKVESHVKDAVDKGGRVLIGGKRHALGRTFFEPTVIADANDAMIIFRDEVFGPVAPLIKFTTDEEAVALANDTIYGLAAYLYTENVRRAWAVAEALEYGMVGVNETAISTELAPFGGIKQSGLGREGSKYGIEEYVEAKYICIGNIPPM